MPNESGYVILGEEQLHYIRIGKGDKLLIAFHGYGNDAALFMPFGKYLGDAYTIISIDLPHHGKSKWPDNKQLHKKQLEMLVAALMKEFKVSKASFMGYSMGGRVCLTIATLVPDNIDKILLIAPDGLVFNPLYYFVTQTFIGRSLFNHMMTQPERYLKFFGWLKEKKWLDASRYKFAMQYLQDDVSRSFLQRVWPGMAAVMPDRKRLKLTIKQKEIPVYIFMGMYDRIIQPKFAHAFKKDMETVQLFILEKGHRVFDNETMPQIAGCLLK